MISTEKNSGRYGEDISQFCKAYNIKYDSLVSDYYILRDCDTASKG